MDKPTGFIAYPATPRLIGQTIEAAVAELRQRSGFEGFKAWRESDIAGHFIATEILQGLTECDCFVADISRLNFNVTYEVGYAIGQQRRIILVQNAAITPQGPTIAA